MFELRIHHRQFPALLTPVVDETMTEAAPSFSTDHIGASYVSDSFPAHDCLAPDRAAPFHMLSRAADPQPITNLSVSFVLLPGQRSITPERWLHHGLAWLKDALVRQQVSRRLPPAHAFILRPRSLLVLRRNPETDPGAIRFRADLSGHDILEEIVAIEADFPGCFRIHR